MNSCVPLVRVENLKKLYTVRLSAIRAFLLRQAQYVHAIDGIDFHVKTGEVLGLSGMSGCGKTTTGKILALLEKPTSGNIFFNNQDITTLRGSDLKTYRKQVQMIFQDPYQSLDPRYSIYRTLAEPLAIHRIGDSNEWLTKVSDALARVGLTPPEEFLQRYPHELSGGQRQRVVIARAIMLQPSFIVADEPVSMLDVSVRIGILNLLLNLKNEMNMAYLFISHDLAVQRYICDRIAIMYLGVIVESGPAERIVSDPLHPYTKILVSSIPVPDPGYHRKAIQIKAGMLSAVNIPGGCRFHPRCPYQIPRCKEEVPSLVEVDKDHVVACHLVKASS
jgi:peptide/nickel transport system ATP-binding protein